MDDLREIISQLDEIEKKLNLFTQDDWRFSTDMQDILARHSYETRKLASDIKALNQYIVGDDWS